MDQRDRPVRAGDSAQPAEGDGVVATQHDRPPAGDEQLVDAVVDLLERGVDVERVAGHVAGVDRLHDGIRRDVLRRVVRRPQMPRRLPDRGRAEAGAWPERHAAVERRAEQRDFEGAHLVDAG